MGAATWTRRTRQTCGRDDTMLMPVGGFCGRSWHVTSLLLSGTNACFRLLPVARVWWPTVRVCWPAALLGPAPGLTRPDRPPAVCRARPLPVMRHCRLAWASVARCAPRCWSRARVLPAARACHLSRVSAAARIGCLWCASAAPGVRFCCPPRAAMSAARCCCLSHALAGNRSRTGAI